MSVCWRERGGRGERETVSECVWLERERGERETVSECVWLERERYNVRVREEIER